MADMKEAGEKAWKTGTLRFTLAMLLGKYNKEEIEQELEFVEKHLDEYK